MGKQMKALAALAAVLVLPALVIAGEGDYDRGVAYLRAGKPHEAVKLLQPLATKRPTDPYVMYHLGLALYKDGDLDGAYKAFSATRELTSKSGKDEFELGAAFSNLGTAYFRHKEYDKALGSFGVAASLDPSDADVRYYTGLIRIEKGEYDGAVAELRAAMELKTTDEKFRASVQNAVGMAYFRQEKNDIAATEFNKTLTIDPDNVEALYYSGLINYKTGGYSAAQPFFERLANNGATDEATKKALFTTFFNMGVDYQDRDKSGEAASMFGKAVKLRPDDPDAHFYLGYNLMALERYEEAAVEFKAAIALKPDMDKASAQLEVARKLVVDKLVSDAQAASESGDYYSAVNIYERAAALDPSHSGAKEGLAGARAKAEADTRARVSKAKAHLDKGEYAEARAASQQLMRLNHGSPAAVALDREVNEKLASLKEELLAKAKEAEAKDALGEAAGYYESIIKVAPEDDKATVAIGRVRDRIDVARYRAKKALDEGRLPAAVDAYETLVKYLPDDEAAKAGLKESNKRLTAETASYVEKASDALASGDVGNAASHVNHALELSPKNEEALSLRAKINTKSHDLVQRHVKEGEGYLANGQADKAAQSFREALRFDPGNEAALRGMEKAKNPAPSSDTEEKVRRLYLSGVEHYTKGELREAIAAWREVLKLDPGNQKASGSIARAEEKLKEASGQTAR